MYRIPRNGPWATRSGDSNRPRISIRAFRRRRTWGYRRNRNASWSTTGRGGGQAFNAVSEEHFHSDRILSVRNDIGVSIGAWATAPAGTVPWPSGSPPTARYRARG